MKEIPLSRGYVALVDDDDFEELSRYKWSVLPSRGKLYAKRNDNGKTVLMHRQIKGVTDRKTEVDHKDWDGLNNQRYNLRVATRNQNEYNKPGYPSRKLPYKGVCAAGYGGRFRASIRAEGKRYCGSFLTMWEAAIWYNKASKKLQGEFAFQNPIVELEMYRG